VAAKDKPRAMDNKFHVRCTVYEKDWERRMRELVHTAFNRDHVVVFEADERG
jgi:hypothetical protein